MASNKAKYGTIKDAVWYAHENNMSVPQIAKLRNLKPYSLYSAARHMGITLRNVKNKPKPTQSF
jgi:tRNA U34 5-carboxymethylaminomethyl modifying enzyme MnmG/GidA